MFCTSCGKEITDGAPFCRFCGAGQDIAEIPGQPDAPARDVAPEQPAAPVTDAVPVEQPPVPEANAAPVEQPPAPTMSAAPFAPPVSAPYGQPMPDGAPYGQPMPDGAPYGQNMPTGVPCGQDMTNNAPYGQPVPNGAPYGQNMPASAPYGQPVPNNAPYGQNMPASAPYGQNVPNGMPYGQNMPNGYGVPPMAPPKKKMSLGAKIALLLVVLLVGGFFGARAYLQSSNAPEKTIDRFLEAVSAKDAAALREAVSVRDDALELSDETVKPFLDTYGGNERSVDKMREALNKDLEKLNAGEETEGDGFLRLQKEDHEILGYALYSTYRVEITPLTVKLTSEFDGTEATLNGKKYQLGTKATSVKLMPGTYKGSATYTLPESGEALKSEFTQTILPRDSYGYTGQVSAAPSVVGFGSADYSSGELHVYFSYLSVEISAAQKETELREVLVDGKAYDLKNVGSDLTGGVKIGPLAGGIRVITVRTSTCGFEQEDTFETSESASYLIEFHLTDEAKNEAAAFVKSLLPDIINARYGHDIQAAERLRLQSSSFSEESLESICSSAEKWYESARSSEGPVSRIDYSNLQYSEDPEFSSESIEDGALALEVYLHGTLDYVEYGDGVNREDPVDKGDTTFRLYITVRRVENSWIITTTNW